jgi:hypothetical protein
MESDDMTTWPILKSAVTCARITHNEDDATYTLDRVCRGVMMPRMPSAEAPVRLQFGLYTELYAQAFGESGKAAVVVYSSEGQQQGPKFESRVLTFDEKRPDSTLVVCWWPIDANVLDCGDLRLVILWNDRELGECRFDIQEPGDVRDRRIFVTETPCTTELSAVA